jgi:putative ABC transport system ATP-binding protein
VLTRSNITKNPVVVLADVRKTYRVGEVDVPAVTGVSFEIPRQRFSVIVGPSGSGKTTLLNLIGCENVYGDFGPRQ